mgnify:FL=1
MSVRNSRQDGIEMVGINENEKKYELEGVKTFSQKKVKKPLGKDEELVGHEFRDIGNGQKKRVRVVKRTVKKIKILTEE